LTSWPEARIIILKESGKAHSIQPTDREIAMTEVNYTVKLEALLTALAPVTYKEAVAFGLEHGKSTRSVISKVGHMGLDYLPKVVPAKRPKGVTKAELNAEIAVRLGLEAPITGLDKATMAALKAVVATLG
jgi:hypothetical protein